MSDDLSEKPYLEYLDKEMTIMGILSTFAIAMPSFVLAQLMGADTGNLSAIWSSNAPVFIAASGVSFLAALAFYRQRSALAYWYGQIAIAVSPAPELSDGGSSTSCIDSANSWDTWRGYMAGFYFLYLSLFLFGLGFLRHHVDLESWLVVVPSVVTVFASVLSWYWRQRYSGEDRPEPKWLRDRRRKVRSLLRLPKE